MQDLKVFSSVEDAFVYYTECQFATLEQLLSVSRSSSYGIGRQISIAFGMAEECRRRDLCNRPGRPCREPRLTEYLKLRLDWSPEYIADIVKRDRQLPDNQAPNPAA